MLRLIDVKKDYYVAGGAVHALKGINLRFRKNEFVSVLGASGCGKTTLLNIIGGLDKYTSGDLIIQGKSTKKYSDGDWDTYRNHSIGFIFQSYHLIPHQTVLQNVELALTISGVNKEERRRRAVAALERVGLGDKLNNRPNQLSGGQAQRVAIARALINDPEIVLADEPTGALDSVTSVQIMELLKEISGDRLVIMVTHNPELAEKYSTRIISLLDGEVIGDTMPYTDEDAEEELKAQSVKQEAEENFSADKTEENIKADAKTGKGRKKKASMSPGMAFMLSLKNLLSKGKRTALVSIAGSIGIIGVSMVLAISAGVRAYIASMEDDMLSGNPLSITRTAMDFNALMELFMSTGQKVDVTRLNDKVYVDSLLDTMMSLNSASVTNVIGEEYVSYLEQMPSEYYNTMQYGYDFKMANYLYTDFTHPTEDGGEAVDNVSVTAIRSIYSSVLQQQPKYADYADMINFVPTFSEMPDNVDYVLSQYDVLATYGGNGMTQEQLKEVLTSKDSLIMVLDDNGFTDLNFGQYGYMTQNEFLNFAYKSAGEEYDKSVIEKYNGKLDEKGNFTDGLNGTDFSFFIGENAHSFKWYPNGQIYTKPSSDTVFTIKHDEMSYDIPGAMLPYAYNAYSDNFDKEQGLDIKVKVILQKKAGISYGCLNSGLYYTKALTDYTLENSKESGIVKYIDSLPVKDGEKEPTLPILPFNYNYTYSEPSSREKLHEAKASFVITSSAGINTSAVGYADLPSSIKIYPIDFESKSLITDYLDRWNDACVQTDGTVEFTDALGNTFTIDCTKLEEGDKITYTDAVGLIITMVNTMIEMITIALVAFTALALVVSTVMVGIITYVSVVERIKEIGILRAVGARKKDIKNLFNSETFIIGLAAGIIGIAVTYFISLILNLILGVLVGISTIAALPFWQALIMIAVSIILTLISGLIPASAAAKKDPVVALRTE